MTHSTFNRDDAPSEMALIMADWEIIGSRILDYVYIADEEGLSAAHHAIMKDFQTNHTGIYRGLLAYLFYGHFFYLNKKSIAYSG